MSVAGASTTDGPAVATSDPDRVPTNAPRCSRWRSSGLSRRHVPLLASAPGGSPSTWRGERGRSGGRRPGRHARNVTAAPTASTARDRRWVWGGSCKPSRFAVTTAHPPPRPPLQPSQTSPPGQRSVKSTNWRRAVGAPAAGWLIGRSGRSRRRTPHTRPKIQPFPARPPPPPPLAHPLPPPRPHPPRPHQAYAAHQHRGGHVGCRRRRCPSPDVCLGRAGGKLPLPRRCTTTTTTAVIAAAAAAWPSHFRAPPPPPSPTLVPAQRSRRSPQLRPRWGTLRDRVSIGGGGPRRCGAVLAGCGGCAPAAVTTTPAWVARRLVPPRPLAPVLRTYCRPPFPLRARAQQ